MITILLAEDDIDDQELLKDAFSEIDPSIRLLSFPNGLRILEYLDILEDEDLPRMIILDYNIPQINGAEILRKLRDRRYDQVVKLVWSTSNSELYEHSCIGLGARAYMVKPSNIAGLTAMARTMISYLEESLDTAG